MAGTSFVNDLDGGLRYFFSHLLYNKKIYCYYQPEFILDHYEENLPKLKNTDNAFTRMAKTIDGDASPIMAIYHLK